MVHSLFRTFVALYCVLLACPAQAAPSPTAESSIAAAVGAWRAARSLGTARYSYTATLLPNGRVLVAGGYSSSALAAAELYDPVSNTWTSTGAMNTARYEHTATLLSNGKVLVAGGRSLATAELYDPASGTWTTTGAMTTARNNHTATLLSDGRVLVTGGANSLATTELYDPSAGTWTPAATMASARSGHTATLLPAGNVLVVGGYSGSIYLGTAERYDLATNTWSSAGSMTAQRQHHTATLLTNGKLLVAGGYNSSTPPATAELYDPASSSWSSAGTLSSSHYLHSAVRLADGRVLVAGGITSSASGYPAATAEIYDPTAGTSGTWAATASMANPRAYSALVLLADGNVLAIGGYYYYASGPYYSYTNNVDLYDPGASTWSATASPGSARSDHTATLLPTGQVLVAGGATESSTPLNTAELYDAASATWTPLANMGSARSAHTATLLNHGKVLVAGGATSNAILKTAELYDVATRAWLPLPDMGSPRSRHTATLLPRGQVLITGGTNAGQPLTSTERYLIGPARWEEADSMGTARSWHTATLLPNGRVLAAGGTTGTGVTSNAEVYDPILNDWSPANGLMTTARFQHTATLLPNGQVLVVGGSNGTTALASAELYTPASGTWAATGSLATARVQHTATLMPDGRVLVVGGSNGTGRVDSAELYDPVTSTWTRVGSMSAGRQAHTATLLPSTRVLLVGGGVVSAELYDARGTNDAWRPQPGPVSVLAPSASFTLPGSGFRGPAGGAGDDFRSTSSSVPFLSVLSPFGGVLRGLSWTSYSDASVATALPEDIPFGHYLLIVTSRGIPNGRLFQVTDGTAPDTRFTNTPAAIIRSAQASFTLASSDMDLLGYECRLDGGPFTPCTSPASYNLADGAHTLEVRSVDLSGSVDSSPASHTWTIDTAAPPAPQVVSPASGSTLRTLTPDFSGTAEAGALVTVYLDGQVLGTATATGGNWSLPAPRKVPLGSHEVSATATDAAGNVSARSATVTFTTETRGYYGWGCTSAPASAAPWALAVLGLGLRRWGRRSRYSNTTRLAQPLGLLLSLLTLGLVGPLSGEALAQATDRSTCPKVKSREILRALRLYDELEYESALKALRKFENLEAPNLSAEDKTCILQVRAATSFGLEQQDKAQEDLDKLFELAPELPITVVPPSEAFLQLAEQRRVMKKRKLQPEPPQSKGTDQEKKEPESATSAPANSLALPLLIGLRGEAELLRPGVAPSLMAELVGGPKQGLNLGGALTVVLQPAVVVRAEARLYPLDMELKDLGWLRPYASLGAVAVVPEAAVGARAGAGVGLQRGSLRFFADIAYERVLNAAEGRQPDIVLLSLGIGWLPFAH